MRKIVIIGFVALLSIALTYGYADAKVTGVCVNCHTMHNSQGGSPMVTGGVTGPQGHLALSSCTGCHGAGGITVGGAPNIFGTTTRTAGGTFNSTVVDSGTTPYKKVHNVRDITWTNDEVPLLNTTPGAESGGYTEPVGANQLACAGYRGCHGKHDGTKNSDAGIRGFHHGVETGYRYLQFYDGTTHTDIKGKGSTTWESGGATAGNHNVYYAMDGIDATTNDSISALCALCHGDFHAGTDVYSSSVWIRHPTENLLSDASGWTMASVTIDYENTPFAFTGTDYDGLTPGSTYSTTGARVACVSCHRAHGSDNDDILRWAYSGTGATAGGGGTTKCLACHHRQR
jgi:hypothetical protein